jgi:multiple sugar transport system substrate-binding protein
MIMAVSACSSGNSPQRSGEPVKQSEALGQTSVPKGSAFSAGDVTLSIFDSLFKPDEFQNIVSDPLHKAYPNITLNRVEGEFTPQKLQELISANQTPDLFLGPISGLPYMVENGLDLNLAGLVKKYRNVDFSGADKRYFDPSSDNIPLVPIVRNVTALFYNKGLFDKFGVAYPKDGMTYEEVIQLAKKMTRNDSGVQYQGIWFGNPSVTVSQIGLNYVDPKTDKSVLLTNPDFSLILNIFGQLKASTGVVVNPYTKTNAFDMFFKDQTLSMIIQWMSDIVLQANTSSVNWDMATMPVFPKYPDFNSPIDYHGVFISKVSKHQDAAFQVASFLGTNEESQTGLAKTGRVPVLNDGKVLAKFGGDRYKDKHMDVIAKTKLAPRSSYVNDLDSLGVGPINTAAQNVLLKDMDVNTSLRTADEQLTQKIAAARGK